MKTNSENAKKARWNQSDQRLHGDETSLEATNLRLLQPRQHLVCVDVDVSKEVTLQRVALKKRQDIGDGSLKML